MGSGRYLVVVDDVWPEQAVEVLRQHGPHMRLLVTSPSATVAQRIGGREIGLREMRAGEAVELLRRVVGDERFDQEYAEQAAQVVGRHGLALALVARLWLKCHQEDVPALLADLAQARSRLDTLAVGQAERLPRDVRPEDAAWWQNAVPSFHAVYQYLNPAGQAALRALGAVGARLPFVDVPLTAALLGSAGQMTAARNALHGLAELGVVEPVDTTELIQQWDVVRLGQPEEDEVLYRIPVLWRDLAERQLREAGELGRVSRRLSRYNGELRTPGWRCAVKPLPGTTRGGRWREVGAAMRVWEISPRLAEMARQARLHGLLFDPRLRHLVYRVLERSQRLAGRAGAAGIGVLPAVGMALWLVWDLVQAAELSAWAWLVLAAVACFGVATPRILWMFLVQCLEVRRLGQWFSEVLVPVSLAKPKERARRLQELGIEDGDIWRAMVRTKPGM